MARPAIVVQVRSIISKGKAHKHKQFCPVIAWVGGGVSRPGGQGSNVYVSAGLTEKLFVCQIFMYLLAPKSCAYCTRGAKHRLILSMFCQAVLLKTLGRAPLQGSSSVLSLLCHQGRCQTQSHPLCHTAYKELSLPKGLQKILGKAA